MIEGVHMEPLLLFPDPAPPELAQCLDLAGYPWKAVADELAAERAEPDGGWDGAIICAYDDPERAFAVARSLRKRDQPLEPVLLLISGTQLGDLELRDDLFDDFCLNPFHPRELEARLKHLFWRTGRGTRPELIEYIDNGFGSLLDKVRAQKIDDDSNAELMRVIGDFKQQFMAKHHSDVSGSEEN